MSGNLGQTSLRRRRRARDPMRDYDALPAPLRRWLSEAHLPWSPASALKLWRRAAERGLGIDAALDLLSRSEAAMLRRDRTVAHRAASRQMGRRDAARAAPDDQIACESRRLSEPVDRFRGVVLANVPDHGRARRGASAVP